MKQFILLTAIFFFNLQITIQQENKCVTGCSDCELASNQSQCNQCEQGFILQNNQCLYQNCPSNYQLQRYVTQKDGNIQTTDKCQAICDTSYIENNVKNLCEQTQQCPLSFVGSSNNSLGTIESIYQVNDQITMIVYPTYIKLINSSSGQCLQDISFSNILTILYFKNYLITFSLSNLVSEWIFETNFLRDISQIQKGKLTKKSQFIDLGEGQQAISSYDDSQSFVYFSRIYLKENSLIKDRSIIQFSYVGCALKIISQFMFCFGMNQKLIVKQLFIENDVLSIRDIQQSNLCQNSSFNTNQIINTLQINQNNVSQFLIIQQQNQIMTQIIFDQLGVKVDCNLIDLKEFPSQIRLVDQQEFKLLIAANLVSKLLLMDQNMNEILNIAYNQNQLTDFAFIRNSNTAPMNQYKLITIQTSSQNIIAYSLNLVKKTSSQLKTYPVMINNPLKFASYNNKNNYSDQLNTLTDQDQIFVVNNNLQSVSAGTDQTNFVVMPYQKKIIGHTDQINKMVYSENTLYLLTCSNDGNVIAWYTLTGLNPLQIYKITRNGQKCRDILIYQDTWVVALFTRQIVIFQINNAYINYSYPFQNPPTDVTQFIGQLTQTILLYYDTQFTLLNGDDLKQLSVGPYLDSQIISFQVVAKYNLIIQNASDSLQMYQFDPNQNYSFTKIVDQTYKCSYGDISLVKVDNIGNDNFEVLVGCKKGALVILDSQLKQIYYHQIIQGYPFNIEKYTDNNTYILFCYSTELNQIYAFFHYAFIRSQNKGYLYSRSYSLKFNIGLFPEKDFTGNTNISYMCLMPLSFFTLILKGTYRPSDSTASYGYFTYLMGNQVKSFASKDNNKIQYYGSQSGTLSFDNSNESNFSSLALNPNLKAGTIKNIQSSPFLESIFIIHNEIDVHDIYTQQYKQTISFSSQYSNQKVQNLILSEKNYLMIAFKSQELILKNFYINSTSSFSQMSQINGILLDETNFRIFVYGSSMVVLNFNLTVITYISQENIQTYQQCLISSDLIICKLNSNILSIMNKKTFSQISSSIIQGLSNKFSIYIDELYKKIFLTDNNIQIFDFTGNLIGQVTSVNLNILNFQIFGKNIAVLTSVYIFIFSRQQLTQIIYFKPTGGGNLLGYYYIADYNTLVYYSDEIRYGQLFYFNLSTYQDDGFTISTYTELGIGIVVSLFYDTINSRLNYLDSVGVFYSLNFLTQRSIQNVMNIYDFKVAGSPNGMVVDEAYNSLFIFNSKLVILLNHNLNQKFQIVQNNKVEQFYFKHQQKLGSNQQVSPSYFVFDQNNILYSYKDFTQTYMTYFSNPVRNVFQIDLYEIILFTFDDQILIYTFDQVENNEIHSSSYVAQIKDPKARMFLTNELLLTTEKQLIHINYLFYKDGTNYWKKNVIDYSKNNEYLRNHISFGPQTQKKLFISFSSGRVIYYDQVTAVSQQIISPWQQQGNIKNNFVKLFFKTDSYLILAYRFNILTLLSLTDLQIKAQIDTSTLNNQEINQINSLFVDETNSQCFISFMYEKLIYVLDLKSFSFLQYLSFPNNQYNRFTQTDQYILAYSNSQINFFQRGTLKYVNQIKKINSLIQISSLTIINQNIIIICMNTLLEIYIVNSNKSITYIDSTQISNSEIIDAYYQQNDGNTLRIVGISDNGIFDKIINTQLYFQSTMQQAYASSSLQYSCYSSISMIDRIQGQNIFSYIYRNNILKMQYRIIANQGNTLKSLDFITDQNVQVILAPDQQNQNNTLQLQSNSFQQLQRNDIYFSNFSFIFTQNNQTYQFSSITKQVKWQNIVIGQQNLTGIQILFANLANVTISNLLITNIQFYINNNISDQALILFKNCDNVSISNLTIINSYIQKESLLFGFESIKNIQITNLKVIQNQFYQLFYFNKGQQLSIQQIDIISNQVPSRIPYQKATSQIYDQTQKFQEFYLLEIVGFFQTSVSQIKMVGNINILLLYYINCYSSDTEQVILYDDTLTIADGEITKTAISKDNQLVLSKQNSQPLFNIQATTLNIIDINYSQNQGNIFISNSKTVNIQNCLFQSNTSIDGGAFSFSTITEVINITNSKFIQNIALGSGGALYLYQSSKLILDENSIIQQNQAQIGGGVRIILTTNDPFKVINSQSKIINNIGIIFGKNIGIFPVKAMLNTYSQKSRSLLIKEKNNIFNNQLKYQNNRYLLDEDTLLIDSFNSGDYLYLQLQLIDQYDQILKFNVGQLNKEQYALSVQQELKSYQIQVQVDDPSSTQLSGQTLLNFNQFNESSSAFVFSSLKISAQPKFNRIIKIIITTNSFSQAQINQNILIEFRSCKSGEIQKNLTNIIQTCEICQKGFYQLNDPNDQTNSQILSCLQCPSQAISCQGDQIVLKDGYWRENLKSDQIFSCNQIIQTTSCKESSQDSKQGCIQGFSGPLCQFCDESGDVWGKKYTFNQSDSMCYECQEESVYVLFIIFLSKLFLINSFVY